MTNNYKMNFENKLRFAFYVSGNASRLIKIIQLYPEIISNTFLIINDDSPNQNLYNILQSTNTNYYEFNYSELKLIGKEKNKYLSNILLEKFNEYKIDYVFCFGGKILEGELLKKYKNKIINFHPAILPMFPGIKSIDQGLNANSFLLGNTAHFVDSGIDTGPVILQSILHRDLFVDYESVLDLQLKMVYQIFIWLVQKRVMVNGNKVTIEKAKYDTVTFYPKIEIS